MVCQCFVARSRRGSCFVSVVLVPSLPSVGVVAAVRVKFIVCVAFVALCAVSRLLSVATVARSDLLPFLVKGFAVRSVGFGSSPFFVNFSSALGVGVPLTYFVNFGAAADYYFPIYIKKYIAIRDNGKWGWRNPFLNKGASCQQVKSGCGEKILSECESSFR
nr:MAG TPA: hypothetical protein [Caudoviricetes sp.]